MPSNLLQRGATWLGRQLKAVGGRTVVYKRGQKSVSITIVPQSHESETTGNEKDAVKTNVFSYDWTIVASELILDGVTVEPRAGDRIIETINGVEIVWEVMPIDKTKEDEWADSSGILLTVRTKRIKNG